MDWLSLPVPVMIGPDFLAKPKAARSVWLSLLAFCALRENGGVIRDARFWSKKDWDRLAGTNVRELGEVVSAQLAWWEGDDLHVAHYPIGPEQTRKRQREGGEEGGRRSGEVRKSKDSGRRSPSEGGVGTSPLNGEERRGEEGKGEESKSGETFALTHPDPPDRGPNATDVRTAWCGWFRERYAVEYSWTGRDASDAVDLLKLANGKGVDEIMRRARTLGSQKREKSVTPAILRMAWNELVGRPAPVAPPPVDDFIQAHADGRLR